MRIEHKNLALAGIILTGLSIVLGAFGAHALEAVLSEEKLANFEVGVRYQTYHGLAMLWLSLVHLKEQKAQKLVYRLWLIGVFFFSGSLYLLAVNEYWDFKPGPLVFVTPLGGTMLIVGWLRLLYAVWRKS